MTKKTTENENENNLKKIKKLLKSLPKNSGVYQMKDENQNIIYIGKAKNLKNRVTQYFNISKSHSIKTKKMIEKIHDIDYIECENEFEALVLETNLIKEHRPRYNILMKDDKNYVYIKASIQEDYPRLSIVRKREKDGALYFGPKSSQDACAKLIHILRKIFPIRTCTIEMKEDKNGQVEITKKSIPIPCLDYHIKRCAGPCINKINKEDYKNMIKQIISFLKGQGEEIITKLKYEMLDLAKEKKFEKAAKYRDQIKSIEKIFSKQIVSDSAFTDRDVIGIFPDFDKTFINLFQIRNGKLINQENFILETPQNIVKSDEEQQSNIIESFLRSYYSEATDIPSEIFLRDTPKENKLWESWLSNKRKENYEMQKENDRKKVHFSTPVRGKKNKILEFSEKNAATFAKQSRAKWMSDIQKTSKAIKDLAEELGLEKELTRIECYDISHMAGEHSAASMVVFIKGASDKKQYRHFKIKKLENGEIDDYTAISEILSRRIQRLTLFNKTTEKTYFFKKPLKKDFLQIEKSLRNEKKIRKKDKINVKNFTGIYFEEEGKKQLVGYCQLIINDEKKILLGNSWIEEEHSSRAVKHQLWSKAFEKIKSTHVYAITTKEQKENYLSFGFTELKKVPSFLKNSRLSTPASKVCYLIYKIKKISKKDSSFSQIPDLIIVDGGRGQLRVAQDIISNSELKIPVIGLAKKEEEIFMSSSENEKNYRRILLPKNSQALYLVQRIRDESHRFANELRKKLGKKQLTASEIDDIPGIGIIIKRRLLKEFGSINAIKKAPIEDLEKVVGRYIAKKLREKLLTTFS